MVNELLSHHLFVKILILFVFSRFLGELFERMNKPSMIGEILAGIILGASVLGWINVDEKLKVIADMAVFFLVILAGLEIDVDELKDAIKGRNIWVSIMGFIVPISLGFFVGLVFSLSMLASLFLGLCISITALPVSIRLLMDIGKLNTDIGKKIVSTAAFNDIVALMILGVLINTSDNDQIGWLDLTVLLVMTTLKVLFFFIVVIITHRAIQWITSRYHINFIEKFIERYLNLFKSKESIFSIILLFILIFSSISEIAGIHMVVGTFFGALLLRKEVLGHKHYHSFEKSIGSISMGFLSPLFFAVIGLNVDVKVIDDWWLLIIILIISVASKVLGGFLGGIISGHNKKESFILGIGLNGKGLMDLVIATIAYDNGFINESIYVILVLIGIFSTLSTSYLLKPVFDKIERKIEN